MLRGKSETMAYYNYSQVYKDLLNLELKLISEIDSAKEEDIMIGLPKFKAEHKVNLKDALEDMGVTDMFTPGTADFSNMLASKRKDIYLNSVYIISR